MAVLLAPVAVVLIVALTALWVLADARQQARAGTPVIFRLGSLIVSTPAAWALACLLLFVIFVPIYALARQE